MSLQELSAHSCKQLLVIITFHPLIYTRLFTNTLHGDEPSAALCQAQGALMLAFSPALSALALSLVLTVCSILFNSPLLLTLSNPPLRYGDWPGWYTVIELLGYLRPSLTPW